MPSASDDNILGGVLEPGTDTSGTVTAGGDPAVWTLLGEAGADPKGQLAVASTVYNRAKLSGRTPQDIVTDPTQGYEAWNDPKVRAKVERAYPIGSPQYTAAQQLLADMQAGKTPPLPYTHFYGPEAQASKKRPIPDWAKGQTGTDIGGNRFYNLPDQLGGADDASIGGALEAPAARYEPGHGVGGAGQPGEKGPPPEQAATFGFLAQHGFRNESAPLGSPTNPAGQVPGLGAPSEQGSWYVTPDGKLRQTGDATDDYMPQYQRIVALRGGVQKQLGPLTGAVGVGQGLIDVGQSLNRLSGGALGSTYEAATGQGFDLAANALRSRQRDIAERNAANLLFGNDPLFKTGRFVGQMVPVTAATMGTGEALGAAGPVGEFLAGEGGLASKGVAGALQGAQAAGLTSATSDQPLGSQLATGAVLGGGLGVGGSALRGVANAAFSPAKAFIEPMTEGGRENILNRNLANLTGGPVAADMTEYVPGSRPTLAEATHDPNLAVTERTLRSTNPLAASAFNERANANAAARANFVDDLRGTPQDLETLDAQREAQTSQLREQAFASKQPTDASSVVSLIDGILKGPEGKRAVVRQELSNVRDNLFTDGKLETDPEQLYGVRKAINDALSPLAARSGSQAQLASSQLIQVRDALDGAIEQGAPGFNQYLQAYRAASGPIDALSTLQGLNLTDMRGNITLGRVNSAITQLERQRGQSGANPAKALTDEQMQGLYNLRNDLQRSDLTVPLGRAARASVVTGNLPNEGMVNALMSPLGMTALGAVTHHPVGAAAVAVGKTLAASKQAAIQNMLIDRMLNPSEISAPLSAPRPAVNPLIRSAGKAFIPAAVLLRQPAGG